MDRKVASKHTNKYSPSGVRTVGPDEFKQALLKCVSKQAKSARGFALIGIILQNAETVRNVAGDEAVDRLSRALRSGIARETAEQDLLCAVSERRLLVLKTDEPREVEEYAARLHRSLASMTIAGTPLRPALDVRVVESSGHLDVSAMLSELGCELDEHGELRENVRRQRHHSGELASWLSRYSVQEGEKATDTWSGKPVLMRRFRLDIGDDDTCRQSLLKNAKNLQSIDHVAIAALVDFWLDDEQFIAIEPSDCDGAPLLCADNLESARELAEQYLSILLYLQALTPPVVPTDSGSIVLTKKKLRLVGWQAAWLQAVAEHKTAAPKEENYVAHFRSFVQRLGAEELITIVEAPGLITLHKIRAALKHA